MTEPGRVQTPTKPCPKARGRGRNGGRERVPQHVPHGAHYFWSGNEHIGENVTLYRCPGYYPYLPLEVSDV